MDDDQQFCLRWNNHQSTLISVFDTLLENGTLVDCTLAAEGKFLKAHKVVLSACSPYFAALLSQQYDKHPIFILKDVKFQELRAMMDYMYRGEVNISQDQLAALLKAAESLQIKGLSDNRGSSSTAPSQQKQPQNETSATKTLPPPVPAIKATGLTIENKRPSKPDMIDSDISGSREGSASPTSRKRKKLRRRSVDNNNLIDNHDQHSNSSSHSMHTTLQPQAPLALTASSVVACVPASNNAATSLLSSSTTPSNSSTVLATTAAAAAAAAAAAIKKTDSVQQQQVAEALKLQLVKHQTQQQTQQQQPQVHHTDDEERSGTEQGDAHDDDQDSDNEIDEPQIKRPTQGGTGLTDSQDKSINQSELMIEPKNEYDDGQDENVEDLTLDEEELLDDLDQAGPSHGGEGSSQGYAQWQMEREQSEAFMATQDAVGGQHRDAQDKRHAKPPTVATAASAKKIKTITFTAAPSQPVGTISTTATPTQLAQITQSTPVVLNDLNDCLLESKNIVVSKKDNKYILFTTAPISQQQSPAFQPSSVQTNVQTIETVNPIQTATVIDTGRIEELLKKDKIIKRTELQGDGTTTTTYIFDECDILPLKSTSKELVSHSVSSPATVETLSISPQQTILKPATISIVKVGASDIVTTAGTAVIPVGTALIPTTSSTSISSIGSGSTFISASSFQNNQSQGTVTRKLVKATHPRIKYSKHKNPSIQSVATLPILTIPTVTTNTQSMSDPVHQESQPSGTTTKIELLNFSLSRKFPGQGAKTIDVSNIQQIPISAISKNTPTRYTVNEYETSTSNTSQSNDFTTGMIDDLDYSVIDDIELPDDVQVNFADSYTGKESHTDIEEQCTDSQDLVKELPTKKPAKSEAKLLNTAMDDKYALLANTSIMKNFEYTVNESVVSDNDDSEMRQYVCRHCGKRYRWKSTLRRHENVECGGKEAMHQCPYCTYKAKQRGNLGVHIRKHHADMPQLESRRKSKNRDSLSMIESIKPEAMELGNSGQM